MKGRLQYQSADPYFYNSEEGWFINNEEPSSSILLSQESIDKIESGEYNIKSGDIVEYKVEPHCFSTEDGKTIHSAVAHLILDEKLDLYTCRYGECRRFLGVILMRPY
mgnify:CR=1 FL=1